MSANRRRLLAADRPHERRVGGNAEPAQNGWYRIVNAAGDGGEPAVVYLYDDIGGGGFFSTGITADRFVKDLDEISAGTIELRVNSPGGDVFDGVAIYNALVRHPATVHAFVDGLAASAASFITMAADKVTMGRGTELMIHDAYTFTIGDEADHLEVANVLGKISDDIAGLYAERAGGTAEEWRERMRDETWFGAQEAVDAGLADDVTARQSRGEPEPEPKDALVERYAAAGVFRYHGRADAASHGAGDGPPAGEGGGQPEPADSGGDTANKMPLEQMLRRADALIAGHDPDAMADPIEAARIAGRFAAHDDLAQLSST